MEKFKYRSGDYIIQDEVISEYGIASVCDTCPAIEITVKRTVTHDPLPRPKTLQRLPIITDFPDGKKNVKYSILSNETQKLLKWEHKNRWMLETVITAGESFQKWCKRKYKVLTDK